MKKTILLILCLLLIPSAFASVDIDDVRAYINNERAAGFDEGGGDIEVERSDTLEVIVDINNNQQEAVDIKLRGTIENIDDGSDIEKLHDWYGIDANDDKSKTLSFVIPADAVKDTYDFEIDVWINYANGTEGLRTIKYDIELIVEGGDINLESSFNNLTMTCNSVVTGLDTCFGFIERSNNLSFELSDVKEERGQYKSDWENTESLLATCRDENTQNKLDKQKCENDKSNMFTLAEKNTAVADAEKKKNQVILIVIGGAVGLYLYQNKKRQNVTVADKQYMERRLR